MSDNIERALGRVEAKVDTLLAENEHDKARRKDQYQRLAAIENKQNVAEKERAQISERLKTVEQNTADFNKWRERATGAVMLISALVALIGGGLATSWHKIIDVFR